MLRTVQFLFLIALAGPLPARAQGDTDLRTWLDSCNFCARNGEGNQALRYVDKALETAYARQDSAWIAKLSLRRSDIWFDRSEYNKALLDLQNALGLYEELGDDTGVATVYNSIGSVHFYDRNYPQALYYYRMSLRQHQRLGDTAQTAMGYGNVGAAMQEIGQLDSALVYLRRHLAMRKAAGAVNWLPICYVNLGSCFERMGELDSATHYLELGLAAHNEIGGKRSGYVDGLRLLGMVHLHSGHYRSALDMCGEALALAQKAKDLPTQEGCYMCLSQTYEAMGDPAKALRMYRRYTAIRDSVSGNQRNKELIRLELTYNFERERLEDSLRQADKEHQAEMAYQFQLSKERYQKNLFLIGALAILMLAVGLWRRLRHIQHSRRLVQRERDRSDNLLLNILPKPIAEELKTHGKVQVREVGNVSILFTDFNEFTRLSERMAPQDLVAEIDACYRAFDEVVKKYDLEKIKTIGDSYMCAGGLPDPRPGSTENSVRAALEMQVWLKERAKQRESEGLLAFRMRAGIHTGHVVAGVVGESKFQYDIWGDTVNTAARMESAGTVGEVNISRATMELVKDVPGLAFLPRGRVEVKGKGDMAMFFVRDTTLAEHKAGQAMDPAVA